MAEFNWLNIIGYVLFALFGGLVVYYKGNPKMQDKTDEAVAWLDKIRGFAVDFIARAEDEFKGTQRGGEKFDWVVNSLYNMLPDAIKPFISKSTIEGVVQAAFDSIQAYAKLQLDRIVDEAIKTDSKEGA